MPLSAADYLVGAATSLLALAAVGWGAWRLRARLVPEWDGALARTAEATIAVAALIGTGQLLAAVSTLRPGATFLALLAVGGLMAVLGTRSPTRRPWRPPDRRAWPSAAVTAAATAAVVAQWSGHTAGAVDGGMTQFDTLWYHGPYSARFLQQGTIGDLVSLGYSGSRFFTLDVELLHALVIMPFGTDVVSPFVNLALLGVVGLAAWAIGQPRGMGAIALLGALVAISFPGFVATQPGQASSDLAAAAFLTAAGAMLLAGGLRPAPTTLAGVAAGLAIGSKLTVAAPIGTLTLGVLAVGLWRHRAAAFGWCLGLAGVAGAWFVRNWYFVRNPVPWFDINVGPLHLRAAAVEDGEPLVETVMDPGAWRTTYLEGMVHSMGRAWPVVLAVLIGGSATLLTRRRRPDRVGVDSTSIRLQRVAGLVLFVSLAAHVVTPLTGGFPFRNNLRYLHPALILAGALLSLVVAGTSVRTRRTVAGVLGALVLVNLTSPHQARVLTWPSGVLANTVAVAAGIVVLTIAALAWWHHDRLAAWTRQLPRAAVAAVLLVVAAGWPVQQHFHRTRYETSNLIRLVLYQPFNDIRDARVAVLGSPEVYPMFGPDLSNRVDNLSNKDRRPDLPACQAWREILVDRYDYIAVVPFYHLVPMDLEEDELKSDPAATEIARNVHGVVYRIDGRLQTEC